MVNGARVAKLVDAYALGAYGVTLGGSIPLPGTRFDLKIEQCYSPKLL